MRGSIYFIMTLIIGITVTACSKNSTPTSANNQIANIQMSDLEGEWQANYASGVTDKLVFRSNGTFRQVFEDVQKGYVFDSSWNDWTIEQSSKGFARLRLQGGRYYLEGITLAETNGRKNPINPCLDGDCSWGFEPRIFYDPFSDEVVHMVDELLLLPFSDSKGKIILHHIWTSSDRGFALIGGEKEIFNKLQTDLP
jgi:hypothetical protein